MDYIEINRLRENIFTTVANSTSNVNDGEFE